MKFQTDLKKGYIQNWLNDQNSVYLSSRQKITFKEVKNRINLSPRNRKPSLQDTPDKTTIRGPYTKDTNWKV